MVKRILIWAALMPFFSSCLPESRTKRLVYQNIVILSDMSSRIRNPNFPQKDYREIKHIIQCFRDSCVRPGEKIGDKSCISFSTFADDFSITIDIGSIKNLADKQRFVNSTFEYKNCGLETCLNRFKDSINICYNTISNQGLDLISLLTEKIDNTSMIKPDRIATDGIDTTYFCFQNHIYIFTDGYLEYLSDEPAQNSQYLFGAVEIEKVREYCVRNQVNIVTALKEQPLGLPPSKSKKNKIINLHVRETHERDRNTKYHSYKHPKGLRDNEILEAVWRKWAMDSGFKSFDWRKY